MAELRCPFCHAACQEEATRVACAACGAPHHAPCFVEGRGCAATGCRATSARVGERVVDLAGLMSAAEDPAELERLGRAPATRANLLLLAVAALLGALGLAWIQAGAGPAGLMALLGAGAVFWLAIRQRRPVEERPRVVLRDDRTAFDPVFGVSSPAGWVPGVFPDPAADVRDKLRRLPAAPAGPAETPERCPACEAALREPGQPDEPLAFCFHCGASLAPESAGAGGELEGEPEEKRAPGELPREKPGRAPEARQQG